MSFGISQFLIGVVLGVFIAVVSFFARFLDMKGSLATFFLASVIFGVGGWQWTVPMFVFFVSSSLLSKVGKQKKRVFESVFAKSDVRDHGQVLANGGIGALLAVAQFMVPTTDFYPAYLGSVAAVTADTWGTEIGLLSKGKTYSVVSLAEVERGSNGGISSAGMTGVLLGAKVIFLSTTPWVLGSFARSDWSPVVRYGLWIIVAGMLGSLVDSFLGATLQAEYQCTVCGTHTERSVHCDSPAKLVGGKKWMTNDAVNWCCAFTGAATMSFMVF